MTQKEITAQLVTCAQAHAREQIANLPKHSVTTPAMRDEVERQFQAAYLSGVSQTASFLTRGDGIQGCTPQMVLVAVSDAGKQLGFIEEPGKKARGA